jgi:hypothetical protein
MDMSIEMLQAKACNCRGLGSQSVEPECLADGADELRGIVWIDQRADCAFRQRINAPITISANNRQAGGRGFKKHDTKTLACARHDENVSEAKIVGQLLMGDMPGKTHCVRNTCPLGHCLEMLPVIPVADDEIHNIRATLKNPRQNPDHPFMPFVALRCRKPRHGEKYLTSTKLVMLSKVVTFRPSSKLRSKRIRQHAHALGRYIRPL